MFHQGSLQSGIALAIHQQKLVACFVRDDSPESSDWENDWLQADEISSLLTNKAVVLRLEANSTEAGFLAAFCPISQIPTLVVIHNGQLREQLVTGVSRDEFIRRLRTVLGAEEASNEQPTDPTTSEEPITLPAQQPSHTIQPPQPSEATPVAASRPPVTSTPQLQSPLSQAPTPAHATPGPQENTAPATLSPKAKGKQKAVEPDPNATISTNRAKQLKAAAEVRKRKQEENEELKRIQAKIEADRQERRAQAAAQKAERERLRHATESEAQSHISSPSRKGHNAREVHLNVRLFDGRNIKHSFPRESTLQNDVRPWIDEEFKANAETPHQRHPPYTFKHILAPLPSRTLSASDEAATLGDIELAPSATLILIPVQGYTEAYSGAGGGIVGSLYGGVTGLVGGAFGLVSNGVEMVGSALGSVTGYGSQQAQPEASSPSQGESRQQAPGAGVRIRTLADQRERDQRGRDGQSFYNGNTLNFEPNESNDKK